jgi:hypothetical protein
MAAGVTVVTNGPVWSIKYAASSTNTLPYTLCPYDLIPRRLVWRTDSAAVQGNSVILQSQPVGGTATDVYKEVATGAYVGPVQQTPDAKEKWPGPIVITEMDDGELLIYL